MDPDNDAAPAAPQPTSYRPTLQPGQLSKPEKVWASATTLVIGFYQAAPYSDAFKIFYKKSGAVFGTQVILTPASILGPELAVRQPVAGEVQYFEYEIKKLKASTQYVIKVKTSDDSSEVRSDKMGTVSQEEERARDNDMRNFVGALVKLGDYDGLVVSYTAQSGIFAVRILQIDDVAASLQLARLTSDYTDNGVPVQAYTLSQVRFGRWGGAITGSKVVNEGELKWLVARAVQMNDKSDAAAAFEARQRMLQSQVEKVTVGLEVEWSNRFRSMRLRSQAYLLLLALLAIAAGVAMFLVLRDSGRRQRDLRAQLAEGNRRQAELEAELQLLHLYRVSLELDVARRVALADGGLPAGGTDPATSAGMSSGSSSSGSGGNCTNNSGSSSSTASELCGTGGGVGGRFFTGGASAAFTAAFGTRRSSGDEAGAGAGARGTADGAPGARSRGGSEESDGEGREGRGAGTNKQRKKEPGAQQQQRRRGPGGAPAAGAKASGNRRYASTSVRGKPADTSRRGNGGGGRAPSGQRASGPRLVTRGSVGGPGSSSSSGGSGGNGRAYGHPGRGGGATRGKGRAASGAVGYGDEEGERYDEGEGGGGDRGDLGNAQGLWGLPHRALRRALAQSRAEGGTRALRQEWMAEAEAYGRAAEVDEQPDAWAFIHYVSHVYAMYLQEWMKVQLQKNVRHKVNEMLLPSPPPANRTTGGGGGGDGDGSGSQTAAGGGGSSGGGGGGAVERGACLEDEYGVEDCGYEHGGEVADYMDEYGG